MFQKTPQKRVLFVRILMPVVLALFGAVGISLLTLGQPAQTYAAANSSINFQARLLNTGGAIVPDGNYNVEFKLYNASTSTGSSQGSCTGDTHCLWTETYTGGNVVRVADGYLTVNLGSITSFPTTINWNQQVWLGMNIGGTGTPTWDGEMSPRLLVTAVPYALSAQSLSTYNASNGDTSQLNFTAPTSNDVITLPDATGTVCLDSTTACGFLTGTGAGVQLQAATPGTAQTGNFNITGVGISGSLLSSSLDTAAAGTLTIGSTTATTVSIASGTTVEAVNVGTGGTGAKTVTVGSTASTSSVLIQSGTGNLSLQTQGTGTLGVGNNGVAQIISIGNTTGATSITENVGTGNYTLNGVAGSTYSIGAATTTGTISIGGTAQTGTTTIGRSTASNTITIGASAASGNTQTIGVGNNATAGSITAVTVGSAISTSSVTVQSGTGNLSLQTQGTGTLGVGNNAVAQILSIGNTTGATSIAENVGTGNFTLNGVGASTYTIGAATTNGTLSLGGTAETGTLTLGASTASNTINIGANEGNGNTQAVNIGTSSTAGSINNVTLGSTVSGGTVKLQSGATSESITNAGDTIKSTSATATEFQVQNTSGNNIFSVNSSTSQAVLGMVSSVTGSLALANSSNSNLVTITSGTTSGSGYNLILPNNAPTSGLCLQTSTASSSQLVFSSCANTNASISELNFWSANGSAITTLADSPTNVGDELVLSTSMATSSSVSSISGGGVSSWTLVNTSAGNGTVNRVEMWMGTVTTAGSSTITVNYSSAPGTNEIATYEFTAVGVNSSTTWGVDSTGNNLFSGSNTTVTYPTLTSESSGEVYVGYVDPQNTVSAGSTSGFTYTTTGASNQLIYNPSTAFATSYTPTSTQSVAGESNAVAAILTSFVTSTAINNSISTQHANFNVQAATSGTVAGVLQGNASGTADILDVRNGAGTNVFSVGNTGNTLVQPSTNSTAAFQVQNSGGAVLLAADTTNEKVTVTGGLNLSFVAAPTALTATAVAGGTNLNGQYSYCVTYVTAQGQTNCGTSSSYVTATSQQMSLTNVPISTSPLVTARDIYRDKYGSANYSYVGQIANNTGTTFTDNVSDSGLGAPFAPSFNTTGGILSIGGVQSLIVDNTNGNLGLGGNALNTSIDNTYGVRDIAIGENAEANACGVGTSLYCNDQIAIGYDAMQNTIQGGGSVGIGSYSLQNDSYASGNTAVGYETLQNTTNVNNTALGDVAGATNVSGQADTYVGYASGNVDSANNFATPNSLYNSTAIGNASQVQANNSLVLGGTGGEAVNVGIGTTIPLNTLSVSPINYNPGTASQSTTTITGYGTSWTSAMIGDVFYFADGDSVTITGFTNATTLTTGTSKTEAQQNYYTGTASQSSTTITGTGTNWTASMVGEQFIFANGATDTITGFTSATSLTGSNSQSVSAQNFRVQYAGLQVTSGGNVGIGTNVPAANEQLAVTGNTLVEASSNSTSTFQIQNSSGTTILNTDTTNSRIGVDNSYALMTVPSGLSVGTATAGGILTASTTYYYKVTAVDSNGGETTVSSEASGATTSSNKVLPVTWTAVPGATAYKIYRSTSTGTEKFLANSQTNSFTDNGIITISSTSPPSSNTAYISTNLSNNNLQVSVGGNGTPTGQLYVSGNVPSGAVGSVNGAPNGYGGDTAMAVQGNYAYIVAGNSSVPQGVLIIEDISNPSSPVSISSTYSSSAGWNAITVQGNFAYLSGVEINSDSGDCTVSQVYNISNPSSPSSLGSAYQCSPITDGVGSAEAGHYMYTFGQNYIQVYDVTNPAYVLAGNQVNVLGIQKMIIQGRYAYITGGTSGKTFYVYDLSNPALPTLAGSYTSSFNIQNLAVQGRYVYESSGTTMQIYDVSSPTSPKLVSSTTTLSGNSISVDGRYAYVGTSTGMQTFDVSNPSAPVLVGTTSDGTSTSTIAVQGRYAYLDQTTSYNTLNIFDIGGTYSQSLQAGSLETGNLQVDANAAINGSLTLQGNEAVGQNLQIGGNIGLAGNFEQSIYSTTAFQIQNTIGFNLISGTPLITAFKLATTERV